MELVQALTRKNHSFIRAEKVRRIMFRRECGDNLPQADRFACDIFDHNPAVFLDYPQAESQGLDVGVRRMKSVIDDQIK